MLGIGLKRKVQNNSKFKIINSKLKTIIRFAQIQNYQFKIQKRQAIHFEFCILHFEFPNGGGLYPKLIN